MDILGDLLEGAISGSFEYWSQRAQNGQIRAAKGDALRAQAEAMAAETHTRKVEHRVEQMSLVFAALWSIVKELRPRRAMRLSTQSVSPGCEARLKAHSAATSGAAEQGSFQKVWKVFRIASGTRFSLAFAPVYARRTSMICSRRRGWIA